MKKKYHIQTYGCQMNVSDSELVETLLVDQGFQKVDNPDKSDILFVNTCSIRERAQEKVFSQLGQWRPWKELNPNLIIGVGGCVASQEGDAIKKRAPFVDIVFGPQTLHRLPTLIDSARRNEPAIDVSFPEIEKFDCLPTPRSEGPSAFVSIMEGCSKYCTFCVVPYTRGTEISRPFDDVIAEVVSLARQGVREVNLLGQNVNAYRGFLHDGDVADLALLIRYVAAVDGIDRIRYTTSHPVEFSDSLIEVYADVPELVNHVHLPVQSGSDRILMQMKRGHSAFEYKQKIRKLRNIRPSISLSSDFIIGFPGETDQDFEYTMKLIDEIGFDHSYSFIYSQRPGTPAAELFDNVTLEIKQKRLQILQHKINNSAQKISREMINTNQTVLVDRLSKKNDREVSGRTENNRVVNFEAPQSLIGQFAEVRIINAMPNSLRGELLNKSEQVVNA